jgi:hypothetical protein
VLTLSRLKPKLTKILAEHVVAAGMIRSRLTGRDEYSTGTKTFVDSGRQGHLGPLRSL